MAHVKIISFNRDGAACGLRVKEQLKNSLTELYLLGADASLGAVSLPRLVQQAMVDCDLIIFIGSVDAAAQIIAPYIANNGYDPGVICVDESMQNLTYMLKNERSNAEIDQIKTAIGLIAAV